MKIDDILERLGLKEESKSKAAMNFIVKNWWVWCLLAITIFSFWSRMIPAKYGELQALDPFFAYRLNEEMLANNLQMPAYDHMRYWPDGVPVEKYGPLMYLYIPPYLYVALQAVGMSMSFLEFAIMFPALFGALSVFIIFFLALEIFNDKKAALFSSVFLATVPGYIARTSAGFFDKEALGGTFLLLALFFFARSYNKGSWKYSIAAAVPTFISMGSWGGGQFIIYIVSMFVIIKTLLNKFDNETVIASVPILIAAVLTQRLFLGVTNIPFEQMLAGVTVFIVLSRYLAEKYSLVKKEQLPYLIPGLLVAIVLFVLIGSMFSDVLWFVVDKGIGLITVSQKSVIGTTVAEQMSGTVADVTSRTDISFATSILPFLSSYKWVFSIWFLMSLGAIFAVYNIYDERKWILILPLFWLLMSVQTVFYMVRLVFFMGPPAAIMAGYFMGELIRRTMKIDFHRKIKNIDIKLLSIPLIIFASLVLISNLANGYVFCNSVGPSYNQYWEQSMNFMKTETPANSSILSWWDFGYWFQTRGERPSIADGGNINGSVNFQIADWYVDDSANWTSYREWLKSKDVDYILMDYTLPGKYGAISKIASRGVTVVGILQMQQTGMYPQDNRTIVEFKAGQYVIWVPVTEGGNIAGAPVFMVTDGDKYLGRSYITDICTTNGIVRMTTESGADQMPGCIAITGYGLFYIPVEAEFSIFTNLMFMDGYGIPDVEKVYDNTIIKIYKVEINETVS